MKILFHYPLPVLLKSKFTVTWVSILETQDSILETFKDRVLLECLCIPSHFLSMEQNEYETFFNTLIILCWNVALANKVSSDIS